MLIERVIRPVETKTIPQFVRLPDILRAIIAVVINRELIICSHPIVSESMIINIENIKPASVKVVFGRVSLYVYRIIERPNIINIETKIHTNSFKVKFKLKFMHIIFINDKKLAIKKYNKARPAKFLTPIFIIPETQTKILVSKMV